MDDTASMNTLEDESEKYFDGVLRELDKNENYRYWTRNDTIQLHDLKHKRALPRECVTLSTLVAKHLRSVSWRKTMWKRMSLRNE